MQTRLALFAAALASAPLPASSLLFGRAWVHQSRRDVSLADDARRPLDILGDSLANAAVVRAGESSSSKTAYCKYDAIRELTAASRERSYAQGRQGCCSKASDYLDGGARPPAGSRWSRQDD